MISSNHYTRRHLIKIIILSSFFLSFIFPDIQKIDKKAIWVISTSMGTEQEIKSALLFAYNNNYNMVFLQVRSRGDAFYNSNLVDKNPNVNPQEFDPLAYAIELGHSLGLEVHAWVNTYILWSSKFKPDNKNHIYHLKPEWAEENQYGKSDAKIDLSGSLPKYWEGVYLSPLHPDVNSYLKDVFIEIAENYDIDGLHFDYIRFHDDSYGYNRIGRENFKRLYNYDPIEIKRGEVISTRFGWSKAAVDSVNSLWNDYKSSSITSLLIEINDSIDKLGKDIKLSAAVKSGIEEANVRWSQNWDYWITEGILDFVVPMNYFKEIDIFLNKINEMHNNFSKEIINEKIIMGIANYNQDSQSVIDKIVLTRMNDFDGISIFSYDSHKYNQSWMDEVNKILNESYIK